MSQRERTINYDSENVESVQENIKRKLEDGSYEERKFTMLQGNKPCEVTITDSSRKRCASILMK